MKDIQVAELKEKMDRNDDFFLLDVREDFEYAMHNLGGKLIPLGQLPDQIEDLEAYKDKEVVVMCRSGMRSATAKHMLIAAGFSNVRNLLGGILAWEAEGLSK